MAAAWIRGTFEGECQGGIAAPPDNTRPDARWYGLRLRHGVLRDARFVEVPPPDGTKSPFCQAQLDDCVFVSPNGIDDWHHASVFDVRVHDWQLAHHVEANNRTWAVMRGTLYARVDDGAPEPKVILPAPVVQEDDIGPLPLLLLLGWLAWLWLTCGWVTCCVWAVPVALSHWRWTVTPRAGATALTKGLHAVAGAALFVLALGGFAVGASAAREQCELSVWLPAGFLLLCIGAASVLVVASPLRGIWLVWSVFVSMSCFRSDAVCTDVSPATAYVRGVASRLAPLIGIVEPGGKGGAGEGSSAGKGERGAGNGKGNGAGAGPGESSAAGNGEGSGAEKGEGGHAGKGEGSRAGDGEGSGRGNGEVSGAGRDKGGAESGGRMSVDDALTDPSKFYGEKPNPVRLQGDLLFDFDSDQLKESAQPQLKQLADLLRLRDERRVVLEGHSDGIGGAGYNQELSERRAHAVRQWLIHQEHINPGQLEAQGFGSKRPVVPLSGNRAAQRPNRRVELRVVE